MKDLSCNACGRPMVPKFCRIWAIEIPLRCKHAADPEEHAAWRAPFYKDADGKRYVAVTKPVEIPLYDDGTPTPTTTDTGKRFIHPEKKTPMVRRGAELDLAETLKHPRVKPKDQPHLHWKCATCGFESIEKVTV